MGETPTSAQQESPAALGLAMKAASSTHTQFSDFLIPIA